jgi:hypothetical protein
LAEPQVAAEPQSIKAVVRDGYVQMLDANGSYVEVPQGSLREAIGKGYTPAAPEAVDKRDTEIERGTLGQQALTLGEAALSTATLGISDFVGKEISPEWAQATKERREVNPNVTLAGEIAGAVIPAIASGGTSAVARGVSAVGAPMAALGRAGMLAEAGVTAGARALGVSGQSLAGRAFLRGLGGAVAGAVEGGGFEITRGMVASVLDDTEYTAEKLTADIKKGVKWGAIGGGVVGVGSTLVGAAGRKAVDSILQGRTLEQAAADLANKRHVESVVGDLGALGERAKEIGEKIVAADIPMTGGAAAREAVEAHATRSADELVAAARALDDAGIAVPKSAANRMRKLGVDEVADALDGVPVKEVSTPLESSLASQSIEQKMHSAYMRKLEKSLTPEMRQALEGFGSEYSSFIQMAERGAGLDEIAAAIRREGLLGNPAELAQAAMNYAAAMKGLRALPKATHIPTVFRGASLTDDDLAKMLSRGYLELPTVSATELPEYALMRAKSGTRGGTPTVFQLKHTNGVGAADIMPLSVEREVILPAGKFDITGVRRTADGGLVIDAVERAANAPGRAGPWEALAKARKAVDDPERLDTILASVDGVVDDALIGRAATGDAAAQAAVAQTDAAKGALGKAIEDARDWGRLSKVVKRADEVKDVQGKVLGAVELIKTLAMGGIGGIPGMAMSAASGMGRKFLQERGSIWLAKMAKGMARADSRVSRAVKGLAGERAAIGATKTAGGIVGEPDWVGVALEEAFSDQSPAVPALRRAASQTGANVEERYDKLVSQVRTFRDDPREAASILEAATGELAEEHPEVAAAVHQQILSDAAYIDERLGLGQRISLNPLSPRMPVTREEKLIALDIADALNDPPAVLETLAAGRYNAEQWAALEARRPKLYNDFRDQAMRSMLTGYDGIDTHRRIMVGTALKFPADWSMLPENSAALAAVDTPPEEQAAPPGGASVNPGAAEMMATPSQRAIEGG